MIFCNQKKKNGAKIKRQKNTPKQNVLQKDSPPKFCRYFLSPNSRCIFNPSHSPAIQHALCINESLNMQTTDRLFGN